jgi:NAD(P)-dependent dehydrogenase (short-subunit alcohol dehydrogenase family)
MNGSGTFARQVRSRPGGGVLVNITSGAAINPYAGWAAYSASKAAVDIATRVVAAEEADAGLRAYAVAPGVVETPLTAPIKVNTDWYNAYAARSALQRWARADEMVGPTLFLASDAASYVTGTILFADGGWTAIDGRFSPPL